MSELLNKCPLCKSGHFLNANEVVDHSVSKEKFMLCKCSKCELLFTNPRPAVNEIAPYYDFPEYYSHDDKTQSVTQFIYQKVRKYTIAKKIDLLNQLKPEKGSVLDYGCGTAALLMQAKKQGWKVTGIEPNEKARTQANKKIKGKIHESIQNLKKDKFFDIIMLFHVLEHIHDLRKTLKEIIKHLKSDGYILIAVPNPESLDAKQYGTYWAGWDVPRHLYHFNSNAMAALEEHSRMKLIEVRPMPFDSYYVSLLSEGYKQPNQSLLSKYLKAIISGYKSNAQAKAEKSFYSSNLFIFQKT